MSFILDALKKSESDRQQKAAPGIADVPTATRPAATSRWIPVLVGLLVVNLGVVAYVLLRPSATATTGSSTTTAPTTLPPETTRAATVPADNSVDNSAEPQPAIEADMQPEAASAGEPAVAEASAAPEPAATTPESTIGTSAADQATVDPPEPPPAEAADDETWLTLNDLRASGSVDLPDMHIDLHVYSQNPAERFVFINMQQYRENATMTEGPQVRRITPEGVVLDYRGTTFLLPRE